MTVTRRPRSAIPFKSLALDFAFLFFLIAWFSGGGIGITPELQELFRQKPAIHRLLMCAAGFAALGVALLQNRPGRETPLIQFVRSMPLTHKQWVAVIFAWLSTVLVHSSWVRHDVFHTSFDMAIFTQAVWNTAHGDFLYSSIKGGICLLGDHFSPLLAAFALPYFFWPEPKLLLLLQALAAASCIFPLDELSRMILKRKSHAMLMIFVFCLYLPLRNAIRFDFHPEVAVMPLLLYAFVYLLKGRTARASLCLMIALAAKENVALVTFMTGFYAVFFQKKRAFGIFWMAFSLLYFFVTIKVFIPPFAPQGYFYLDANFLAWKRFGAQALLAHMFHLSSLSYLVKIFAPVGLLSFLDFPSFLLTLPMLVQNLVARNESARSIFFQYTALLTPYVFISAVYGARQVLKKKWGILYLLSCAILMAGVSEYYVIREHEMKKTPHMQRIHAHFQAIPQNVSVRTHEFFAPHLANRKGLHIYENQNPAEGASEAAMNADYVIVDAGLLGSGAEMKLNEIRQKGYHSLTEDEGFYVFAK